MKRKKMAASRTGEMAKVRPESNGGTGKRVLWHARCTYAGIGPRTRRFPGEMVQSGAGETTPAAKT